MSAAQFTSQVSLARRCAGAAALGGTLLASGYVAAAVRALPDHAWIGWFTLVPLFLAVRLCRPQGAVVLGGLWGLGLCISLSRGPSAGIDLSVTTLALLTGIPAVYSLVASLLTRWIGFSPLVLGVGWMIVELALAPLGLRFGLLGATQGDTSLMQWMGGAFGYVLVAFVVAYVNAIVVSALSSVPLSVPGRLRTPRAVQRGTLLIPQVSGFVTSYAVAPSRPRAPPS